MQKLSYLEWTCWAHSSQQVWEQVQWGVHQLSTAQRASPTTGLPQYSCKSKPAKQWKQQSQLNKTFTEGNKMQKRRQRPHSCNYGVSIVSKHWSPTPGHLGNAAILKQLAAPATQQCVPSVSTGHRAGGGGSAGKQSAPQSSVRCTVPAREARHWGW